MQNLRADDEVDEDEVDEEVQHFVEIDIYKGLMMIMIQLIHL
jgi:hypothetical protein